MHRHNVDENVWVCAHPLHLVDRLKEELAEKHERWLSCQRRCDIMQGQLASLCAAEEEVTRGKEALEKVQLERRELRREKVPTGLSVLFRSVRSALCSQTTVSPSI